MEGDVTRSRAPSRVLLREAEEEGNGEAEQNAGESGADRRYFPATRSSANVAERYEGSPGVICRIGEANELLAHGSEGM